MLVMAFSGAATGCDRSSSPAHAPASTTPIASASASSAPVASASTSPVTTSSLSVGDAAPDVTLVLHDGKEVPLSSLRGKHVVLYFYPKDDTPGCRVEAQGIRDRWTDFESAGVQVFGVSLQDAESHRAFIDKESLPFPLVVDTDGVIAKAFGVPVMGEYAKRQSFLIGRDGKVARVWLEVKPSGHADELLDAAK